MIDDTNVIAKVVQRVIEERFFGDQNKELMLMEKSWQTRVRLCVYIMDGVASLIQHRSANMDEPATLIGQTFPIKSQPPLASTSDCRNISTRQSGANEAPT